jgi:DNA-binding PadR family transcriptional regulator
MSASVASPAASRTLYAVLGLLASGPRSGYDIKKEVTDRISHFWNESLGHLYPVLQKLVDLGWVTRRSDASGVRTRHLYEITDEGRAELDRWLREPVVPTPPRLEILLKTYFGAHTDPLVVADHVRTYREERERQLGMLELVHGMLADGGDDADRYLRMTVRAGVLAARAALEWCDEVLSELAPVTRKGR